MRIGVDAWELVGRPTGVGRYLSALLREWAAAPAIPHSFQVYAPDVPGAREALESRTAGLTSTVSLRGRGGRTAWEQIHLRHLLRAGRPDVLFAPGYTAPLGIGIPVALTIHDVSFLAHPEWFGASERRRRRVLTVLSAKAARLILTDTEFSKREIVRLIHLPPDRIRVVALAVARPDASRAASEATVPAGQRRDGPVLFVGSVLNRRRVPDLIAAFARVAQDRPEATLEIVGENRTWPRVDLDAALRDSGIASRARVRAYVPDEELTALYRRASVFVFLSEYEGFGLTPLEALAHGVPVIVADTEVAREVYRDAAVYVPAGDLEAAAAAIRTLLADAGERHRRLALGRDLLAAYSWERAARETLSAILEAGESRQRVP